MKREKKKTTGNTKSWGEKKAEIKFFVESSLVSGGEHEKSAANSPNYFSILPMDEVSRMRGFYL